METQKQISKKQKFGLKYLKILLMIFLFAASLQLASAQAPQPHNIQGRVFADNSKTTGAEANLPVILNDTSSGNVVLTYTQNPGPPPLKGIYSATILGITGDLIIATSYNATHYGTANTTLLSTTTALDVILNQSRPSETNVTIFFPANNSVRNTTDAFNLTANISILGADASDCNATISFSGGYANITQDQQFRIELGDIAYHSHRTAAWNISGIKEGTLNVTVSASCGTDGLNLQGLSSYTILLDIQDTTPPTINLEYPANGTFTNFHNLTFMYNVSENTGLENCSLYINEGLNQTSSNLETYARHNFTIEEAQDGEYEWFVSCFDNSTGRLQGNSTRRAITVDTVAPGISLLSPFNNSVMDSYSLLFEYNVTDSFEVSNCSFILQGQTVEINTSIRLNLSNNFSRSIPGNDYAWQVNCTDRANNPGASPFFRIRTPDFKVYSEDIHLSVANPSEKQNIRINATIFNLGSGNSSLNLTAQFFEGHPLSGGFQLGSDFSLNISAGGNASVEVDYYTRIGSATIFVVLDPVLSTNGSLIESNESNNIANFTINITAYSTFYGSVISDIFLDTSQNLTVFAWMNAVGYDGNIFATDSESIVNFTISRH